MTEHIYCHIVLFSRIGDCLYWWFALNVNIDISLSDDKVSGVEKK